MRRVVGEINPRWVVGENVGGLLSSEDGRFFRGILRDFTEMGFDVGWATYPAAWIGAVHRRERVAIIAHSNSFRFGRRSGQEAENGNRPQHNKQNNFWPKAADCLARTFGYTAAAPGYLRANYGVSDWIHRLKCLGNAVVPQQFYPIFAAIAEIERTS
jgi:DNA (cytosine-5)-methyltransferase 1